MDGLMMDYDLTVPAMLRRAESLYSHKEIVTRNPDKSFHRYTYADFVRRTKQLSLALERNRRRKRGTGCDPRLEPLPSPGGVLRCAGFRERCYIP